MSAFISHENLIKLWHLQRRFSSFTLKTKLIQFVGVFGSVVMWVRKKCIENPKCKYEWNVFHRRHIFQQKVFVYQYLHFHALQLENVLFLFKRWTPYLASKTWQWYKMETWNASAMEVYVKSRYIKAAHVSAANRFKRNSLNTIIFHIKNKSQRQFPLIFAIKLFQVMVYIKPNDGVRFFL